MATPFALALRPWRALHQTLGTLALALALSGAALATPAPAAASPAAASLATAATARPKATKGKAGKSGKASAKRSKAARGTSSRGTAKARRAAAKASARSTRSRSGARAERRRGGRGERRGSLRETRRAERRAERPAPRPSEDLRTADQVAVPQVVLPDLALAAAAPGSNGGNPFTLITRSATSLLDGLVARARGQLGTRYVYGGADPDNALDCSSFARYVMEALGVRLPRTANQQARMGTPVPRDVAALRPGDLLTFGSARRTSHVGIYLGQGRFIHASVSSGQVIETTIERNRSLFRRWLGARRLLAGAPDSVPAAVPGGAADAGLGTSGG